MKAARPSAVIPWHPRICAVDTMSLAGLAVSKRISSRYLQPTERGAGGGNYGQTPISDLEALLQLQILQPWTVCNGLHDSFVANVVTVLEFERS